MTEEFYACSLTSGPLLSSQQAFNDLKCGTYLFDDPVHKRYIAGCEVLHIVQTMNFPL